MDRRSHRVQIEMAGLWESVELLQQGPLQSMRGIFDWL